MITDERIAEMRENMLGEGSYGTIDIEDYDAIIARMKAAEERAIEEAVENKFLYFRATDAERKVKDLEAIVAKLREGINSLSSCPVCDAENDWGTISHKDNCPAAIAANGGGK